MNYRIRWWELNEYVTYGWIGNHCSKTGVAFVSPKDHRNDIFDGG